MKVSVRINGLVLGAPCAGIVAPALAMARGAPIEAEYKLLLTQEVAQAVWARQM